MNNDSDVLVCDQCGSGVIKNGMAVRKQRWKCVNEGCRKGFYTEIEKVFVDPFKALKGKWVKCGRCGIETVNVGECCDACQVLIEGVDVKLPEINLSNCSKVDQRELSCLEVSFSKASGFESQRSLELPCFVDGYNWDDENVSLEVVGF